MRFYARQGDVGFIECCIPVEAMPIPVRPFAIGESTGHSHRVAVEDETGVQMFELHGRTFLRVTKERSISILHQDHDPRGVTSKLPTGWEGEVVIAREYDYRGFFRRVVD